MFRRDFVRRLIFLCYSSLAHFLPLSWVFTTLVVLRSRPKRVKLLPTSRSAFSRFLHLASKERIANPEFRFSSAITDRFPVDSAKSLAELGAFREGVEVLSRSRAWIKSSEAALIMAKLLFELADFERARSVLRWWRSPRELVYMRGLLELIARNEQSAGAFLAAAAEAWPRLMRPHQNLAARMPADYRPNELDIASGQLGRLYDACNFLGQRVTHVGAGHLGAELYGRALTAQRALKAAWSKKATRPRLIAKLEPFLASWDVSLDELRLLPPEWVTQVGHLGMMDILFRMRELGWWSGKALVVASGEKVANQALLELFDDQCAIALFPEDGEQSGIEEILSLQRGCGLSFNVFEMPTGEVVPWQEAGALAMRRWEEEKRGSPLRTRFDKQYGGDAQVMALVDEAKASWKMGRDDWHVCLHMRDASYYGEVQGTGQSHRNAALASYLPVIEHITRQGGFVIKMGGPESPPLPKMERVIDYARSPYKSSVMDLHLIRRAKLFLGTTSGLTNVAVSFGVPCALVNCITVDAQLWNSNVRFALKPVVTRDGRMLSQRELTTAPWRWRAFSAEVLLQHGVQANDNTSDEILEAVKEVERLAAGNYSADSPDVASLLDRWNDSLGLEHFYGAARPSLYYLRKYEKQFLQPEKTERLLVGELQE